MLFAWRGEASLDGRDETDDDFKGKVQSDNQPIPSFF